MKNTKSRLYYLDGIRGLAAFSVLLSHVAISNNFHTWTRFVAPVQSSIAVLLFFILSGYVLSLSVSFSISSLKSLLVLSFKRYVRLTIPVALIALIFVAIPQSFGASHPHLINYESLLGSKGGYEEFF